MYIFDLYRLSSDKISVFIYSVYPPALDKDVVLIVVVKHADLQVNIGLDHPHSGDCSPANTDGYLFVPT